MDSSRRNFFIMIVDRFIFKNNLITLFPCLTFIPKTGVELPKTGFILTVRVRPVITDGSWGGGTPMSLT